MSGQALYTFADVGSKAVHGLLMSLIARRLSAREGWPAALADPGITRTIDLGDGAAEPSTPTR